MNFRRFSYFIGVISILLPIYFTSCSFGNEGSSSKSSSKGGEKYGSLRIENKSSSRQLEVSAIEKADVSVTGYGISEEKAATLKKQNVSISGGKHLGGSGEVEAVVIEGIPVGVSILNRLQIGCALYLSATSSGTTSITRLTLTL